MTVWTDHLAQERAERLMLNRMTTRAWWRGFRTQRGEY